jgi:hypothetical protein
MRSDLAQSFWVLLQMPQEPREKAQAMFVNSYLKLMREIFSHSFLVLLSNRGMRKLDRNLTD